MDPRLPSLVALNGRITPALSSFILSGRLREVMLATHGPSTASRLSVWSIRRPCSETPPLLRPPPAIAAAPGWGARSRRMPRESLDALENLTKEASRQVALGELQSEVPGMPDEAAARLEQPLLEAREGPALDGDGQNQPTQQIAEVVSDDPEQQADLIGPEPVRGEPGPVSGFPAVLYPLVARPAL